MFSFSTLPIFSYLNLSLIAMPLKTKVGFQACSVQHHVRITLRLPKWASAVRQIIHQDIVQHKAAVVAHIHILL